MSFVCSVVPEFEAANKSYSASFAKGGLALPPARCAACIILDLELSQLISRSKVAVVACMDARLDPAKVLGLQEGDAHVIRNAGGRTVDALRSLIISQQLLGTREVVIIHHVRPRELSLAVHADKRIL